MSLKILITGTTGDSMPPPYAGVPKVALLYARAYKQAGHSVAVTFVYRPTNADDMGTKTEYFFEYNSKPNEFKKILFLLKYFFSNPYLYFKLFYSHYKIYPRIYSELILYSSYGVFMDKVLDSFKPDIILSQATLIKTFMVAELAMMKNIPIVFEPYAEIHDIRMGVNKNLNELERKNYWTQYLSLATMVIGMDNCSVGPLMYLPLEKVKVFYDTCDYNAFQVKLSQGKKEFRNELNLPQGMFLAGMVGAFHYRKGHDHLIKAVSLLNKQGFSNIGAVICGNSSKTLEKWKLLAKNEGIEDKIFFLINFSQDKIIKLHQSLDTYCNLSNSTRSCGLDLALLEAMASGLPLVVYDNGALSRAVPREENGFLIKTNDIKSLAQGILKMYKFSSKERQTMGEKSRALAAKTEVNFLAEIKLGWFKEIVRDFR